MHEGTPILIVEDEPRTAELVAMYLERDGFAPHTAGDGRTALDMAASLSPAMVVLDLMLPELSGMEVLAQLRARSNVPVLILTARNREQDRLAGLAAGADDYVVKPFSPREIVARVHAILRRAAAPTPSAGSGPITVGRLTLNPDTHSVTRDGDPVELTPSEFLLLHALMEQPGAVLSRDDLIGRLYPGGEDVVPRVVDVHMGALRQKIEPDRSAPTFIATVRGFGYQLAETDASSTPTGTHAAK